MRKLTHQELLARQQASAAAAPLPFTVVLNNIRSLHNVGSVFRTADGVGVEKIWLCGITGIPPASQISKTALGAEDCVPWEYMRHASECLRLLKQAGYRIVMLEQTDRSVPHDVFLCSGPVCLVLGNEITGVEENLLAICDDAIEIEMQGVKNSLNAAVAFAVAAYRIRGVLMQSAPTSMHAQGKRV